MKLLPFLMCLVLLAGFVMSEVTGVHWWAVAGLALFVYVPWDEER